MTAADHIVDASNMIKTTVAPAVIPILFFVLSVTASPCRSV
jgi:hypothetical protein